MLKIVIVATVVTLCLSQDLGDDDYIACEMCEIPSNEFPEEGMMVCFEVKNVTKTYTGYYETCYQVTCDPDDIFCIPGEKCELKRGNISEQDCLLERKTGYTPIGNISEEYQIYSPFYLAENGEYPNNTYCVWNVANTGFVNFHILNQTLQEPTNSSDCDGPGCNCPDFVKITMGINEMKLCGSSMPLDNYQTSSGGFHVKFCSDNNHTAKGVFIRAYKVTAVEEQKREVKQQQKANEALQTYEASHNSTGEVDNAICQYNYMMRVSQPDVPCPDSVTILSMLQHHNQFISAFRKNEEMCSRMRYPTSMSTMMPMMNEIEKCAVEYLYHTMDHTFARIVINSANRELRGVAHAVIKNNLLKRQKRMNRMRTK